MATHQAGVVAQPALSIVLQPEFVEEPSCCRPAQADFRTLDGTRSGEDGGPDVWGRNGARTRAAVVVAVSLTAVTLIRLPAEAAASITIRDASIDVIAGQRVTVHGSVSTAVRRPVRLQRRADGWSTIARGDTSRSGAFELRHREAREGQYRVVAPRRAVGGRTYARVVSSLITVTYTNRLVAGQTLSPGQSLHSPDHQLRLAMQSDGNLVLYRSDGTAAWSTATSGKRHRVTMQGDGNLVMYAGTTSMWSTSTDGFHGAELVLQDDGNLVVYQNGRALWSQGSGILYNQLHPGAVLRDGGSITSPNRQYSAVMQADGNFVLYRAGGVAQWATSTNGPNRHLVMQSDGNLVVYRDGSVPVWSTETGGRTGARLVVQDDGNLVLYQGSTPVWSRHDAPSDVADRAASAAHATVGHVWAQDTGDAGYFPASSWEPGPYGEWSGDCVKLAVAAYLKAGLGRIPSAGTARQMYFDYRDRGLIRTGTPPAGALVFWPDAAGSFGHVAVSLGGGQVASTMGLDEAERANAQVSTGYPFGGTMAGWAMPPGA